jgi:hypothetical protein
MPGADELRTKAGWQVWRRKTRTHTPPGKCSIDGVGHLRLNVADLIKIGAQNDLTILVDPINVRIGFRVPKIGENEPFVTPRATGRTAAAVMINIKGPIHFIGLTIQEARERVDMIVGVERRQIELVFGPKERAR